MTIACNVYYSEALSQTFMRFNTRKFLVGNILKWLPLRDRYMVSCTNSELCWKELAFSSVILQPCYTRNLNSYRFRRDATAFALSVRPTRTERFSYSARLADFLSFFSVFFFFFFFLFFLPDRPTFTRVRAIGNETFYWDGPTAIEKELPNQSVKMCSGEIFPTSVLQLCKYLISFLQCCCFVETSQNLCTTKKQKTTTMKR